MAEKQALYKHKLGSTYKNMLIRCDSKHRKFFPNYAGKDIKVCNRWKVFENFVEDMQSTFKNGWSPQKALEL